MSSFLAGLAAGIVIVGLLPLPFWLQIVLRGGRIKPAVVVPTIVVILSCLWLTIVLDRLTAEFVLAPGGLGVVAIWLYYRKKKHAALPDPRIPAKAKRLPATDHTEEELPQRVASGRRGTFKGELV